MNLSTLIDVAGLVSLTQERDVLIVDCRHDLANPARAAREFALGHIPGAVRADLDHDLSDLSRRDASGAGLGRHPLPTSAAFSAVLGRWGWTPSTPVVAYDEANGALAAARLWWMLRLVGQREVAVLDGGLAAWKAAGQHLSMEVAQRKPMQPEVEFEESQIVYTGQLSQLLQNGQTLLLDARAGARYRGEVEPIDAVAGHVPGAHNRPFSDNLDSDGSFKPPAQLRAAFAAAMGSVAPADVVNMCGSGVTACHNLLAMEHAGLTGSRVYAPSWSGWINDGSRPVSKAKE
jgi:thiosulfate/3-mercaptopyruvate sulfurtransferase